MERNPPISIKTSSFVKIVFSSFNQTSPIGEFKFKLWQSTLLKIFLTLSVFLNSENSGLLEAHDGRGAAQARPGQENHVRGHPQD